MAAADQLLPDDMAAFPGSVWSQHVFRVTSLESGNHRLECRGFCLLSIPACHFALIHPTTGECLLGRFNDDAPVSETPAAEDALTWMDFGKS